MSKDGPPETPDQDIPTERGEETPLPPGAGGEPTGSDGDDMRKKVTRFLWIGVVVVLSFLLLSSLMAPEGGEVAYSELIEMLEGDHVAEVVVEGARVAQVKKREGHLPDREESFQVVLPPPEQQGRFYDLTEEMGVKVSPEEESPLQAVFINLILPIGLIALIWIFFLRRFNPAGGSMQFGQNKAKVYMESEVETDFDDVAGVDEAVEEVREVVDFLQHPERYNALGAQIPKGILLVGLPGTGKTLLARAIAGEAEVPFFSLSGSDFMELFVGVGAARVRDLFQKAHESAPCIVFIDEIDVLGKTRGGQPNQGEQEQTLNQLLVELDGFQPNSGVIFLAATNRPELLDAALLRAGRFDRQIIVDRPDRKGREAILRVHADDKKIAADLDYEVIAARTVGMVGADLENLLNEAALLAARNRDESIEMTHVEEAIDRVTAGLEKKNRVLTDEEREIVAYHEAGHALVAWRTEGAHPVHKISMIPRGMAALGFTVHTPADERYLLRRGEIEGRLSVLLGGRTAEDLTFGDVTTGAQDDLKKATKFARRMVTEFGMSERIGLPSLTRNGSSPMGRGNPYAMGDGNRDWSDETAREIDLEVKRILQEAQDRAREVLESDREGLESLAQKLLDAEEVDRDEIEEILGEPATTPSQKL